MMWEMYTGERAYDGMAVHDIVRGVGRHNLRPSFPTGSLRTYRQVHSIACVSLTRRASCTHRLCTCQV